MVLGEGKNRGKDRQGWHGQEGQGCRKGAEWAGSWGSLEAVSGAPVGRKPGVSKGDSGVGWREGALSGEVVGGGRDASGREPSRQVALTGAEQREEMLG